MTDYKKKQLESEWWRLFGLRVAYLRKVRKLTQSVVAENIGVSRTNLSKIENGSRRCSTFELSGLARVLKMSASDVIGNELISLAKNYDDLDKYGETNK